MKQEAREERAQRARVVLRKLKGERPDARIELEFGNPLELLMATVLAAQCTDQRVNEVTRTLFKRYPTARDYANAHREKLEQEIRPTGFFRQKAKALIAIGKELAEKHGGKVPQTMEELTALPGVARKTANVVLGSAMGIPAGIVVDTHVQRVSRRTGLSSEKTPEKIEADLVELLPKREWTAFGVHYTLHGRHTCTARKPRCNECPILELCPQIEVAGAQ